MARDNLLARGDRQSFKDGVLETMGPLEKLAALKLSWWAKREVGPMLSKMFGNKMTTSIGILLGTYASLTAAGVIPLQYQAYGAAAVGILTSLGFVASKDAVTGSPPGADR